MLDSLFNLTGPEFLKVFGLGLVLIVAARLFLERFVSGSGGGRVQAQTHDDELHAYEIATLSGGSRGAFRAAVAALVQDRRLRYSKNDLRVRKGCEDAKVTPLDTAIVEAVADRGSSKLGEIQTAVERQLSALERGLENRGLLIPENLRRMRDRVALLTGLAFIGGGVYKLILGVARDKPVAFLVALLVVALIVLLALPRRIQTRRGRAVLSELKKDHAALKTTVESAPRQTSGLETATAFGLFGAGVLLAGMPDLAESMGAHPQREAGRSHWWGCGGGGDGGGGDGGGGGCGGGGCGGCGG